MGEEASVYMWEWWWGRRLVCTCGSGGGGGGFTQLELASYSCQVRVAMLVWERTLEGDM